MIVTCITFSQQKGSGNFAAYAILARTSKVGHVANYHAKSRRSRITRLSIDQTRHTLSLDVAGIDPKLFAAH